VEGRSAAQSDPLRDALAGAFVVLAHDEIADAVKVAVIDGHPLPGAARFPAAEFNRGESVADEFRRRCRRQSGVPGPFRFFRGSADGGRSFPRRQRGARREGKANQGEGTHRLRTTG